MLRSQPPLEKYFSALSEEMLPFAWCFMCPPEHWAAGGFTLLVTALPALALALLG